MISKRIAGRKDGRTSASAALRYGEGLTPDRTNGDLLDKSHRTRFGGFGLIDDGVYAGRSRDEMSELVELAAVEMQANCDSNTRVRADKKLAHFVESFNQEKPTESVLRDTEDSMLAALKLTDHHFATFLHNDNGYWHLHMFVSCIEKGPLHRGNPLWHDRIKRDQVCREIEGRHGLARDDGLHRVDDKGQIIEIPREERIAKREAKQAAKPTEISERAKTKEIYSGEKSFQTWCNEIRIGDRLKHAQTWKELHTAAAVYGCEVKPKGAGFVICPVDQKGSIQLSKLGLKKLPEKFGVFMPPSAAQQVQPQAGYVPAPTQAQGASHYTRWQKEKTAFVPVKTAAINAQRADHKEIRSSLRERQKAELKHIRAVTNGPERHAAVSIAKMEHILASTSLTTQFAAERQALHKKLNAEGPGNTFRDFLVVEASKGDNTALGLARKHGVEEATDVLRQREITQLKIVAAVAGKDYLPAIRLPTSHHIERNGTVVYNLGGARTITDSAVSKQVQLNGAAANSPEAVAVALRFSMSKFGHTLTLTGSPEFQRMAVQIAVQRNLPIVFADLALDAFRKSLLASQKQTQEKLHASRHHRQQAPRQPPPHLRGRLHDLSARDLVLDTNRDEGVLWPDVQGNMEFHQEGNDNGMQRTAGRPARTDADGAASSRSSTADAGGHHHGQPDERRLRANREGDGCGDNQGPAGRGLLQYAGRGGNGVGQPPERVDVPVTPAPTIQKPREAEPAVAHQLTIKASIEVPAAPSVDAPLSSPTPARQPEPVAHQAQPVGIFDTFTAPVRALEEKQARPTVEEWIAANPDYTEGDAELQARGSVLYVADDGRWVLHIGRKIATVRSPVAGVVVQVGDHVETGREGQITKLEPGLGKGRAG